jgi:AraC-like DNA-binding protein
MDRDYARPLDVANLAAIACVSEAHFIRTSKSAFGETPHCYLQRRRVERALYRLRTTDRSVTDVCMEIGFSRMGTFSLTFRDIVGETPSQFRRRGPVPAVPSWFVKAWSRPSSFGEAS